MRHYITSNPKVLGGKPVISGTRITVDFILELFAGGMKEEEILKEYPRLTRGVVRLALEYASRSLKREEIFIR